MRFRVMVSAWPIYFLACLHLRHRHRHRRVSGAAIESGGKVSFVLPAYGVDIVRFNEASY
jgi:hypothetical protein